MYFYKIYDSTISSEIEMPQLVSTDNTSTPDIIILKDGISEQIQQLSLNQTLCFKGEEFWFKNNTGLFTISATTIRVQPHPNKTYSDCVVFVLGYCISLYYFKKNKPAIHCSCVHKDNKSLIISGQSGSGKSTLSSLYLDNGYSLVADDIAVTDIVNDELIAYPAFPQRKLCRDAAVSMGLELDKLIYIDEQKDKFAIRDVKFATEPVKLTHFILLGKCTGKDIQIIKIDSFSKLPYFLNNLFLYRFHKHMEFTSEFMKNCIEQVKYLNMYIVLRPDDGSTTPDELFKKIEENIC